MYLMIKLELFVIVLKPLILTICSHCIVIKIFVMP